MNFKMIIPAIAILATSSIAAARPIATVSAEAEWSFGTDRRPVLRDHRYAAPAPLPPHVRVDARDWGRERGYDRGYDRGYGYYDGRGAILDEGLTFGLTEYRKDILVGSGAGRFGTLRIDNDGGRTYLMKVVVEYADNSVQVIQLNRTLRGQQSLTLPLNARKAINRVFAYRADGDAALNMHRYHDGAFTVTAF